MRSRCIVFSLAAFSGLLLSAAPVAADPCGMCPPIWIGDGPGLTRVGPQKTYVFYKDGIESIALRPGFSGKVEEFGMLIPFPTVPAIRKVPDDIFTQIACAVDPTEVVVNLRPIMFGNMVAIYGTVITSNGKIASIVIGIFL